MTSRWRSTAFRPALSLAMISASVPVGTSTPFQFVGLEPASVSATSGRSGGVPSRPRPCARSP